MSSKMAHSVMAQLQAIQYRDYTVPPQLYGTPLKQAHGEFHEKSYF